MKNIKKLLLIPIILGLLSSCVLMRDSTDTPSTTNRPEQETVETLPPRPVETEKETTAETEKETTQVLGEEEITATPSKGAAEIAFPDAGLTPSDVLQSDDPYLGVDISFMAVGDNLIHQSIWMGAEAYGTAEKKYDFLPMYEQIRPFIEEADVAFINQETVMAGDTKYGLTAWPTFNSPQQLAYDLAELGFDVLNLATNHLLDKGESGYRDYLDFINTLPFTTVGGYYNKADHDNIRVTEAQGVKIAWLAYTEHTNWIFLPKGSEMYVPYAGTYAGNDYVIDEELIKSDLAAAREIADLVIVSLHCGTEYVHEPNNVQRRITQLMADNGADVILGHHSHCLQPIEWIRGENGNETLCIFSLGNIASGQNTPLKLVGGVFTFRVVSDGEGGLTAVDPLLTPTVMYYDVNWLNDKIYLLENYTDEIAATQGMTAHVGHTLTHAEATAIVKGCIDEQYLPDWMKSEQ